VNQRPFFATLAVLCGLGLFAGCATSSPDSTGDHEFAVRYADYTYCDVPQTKQSAQRSCGAAALNSVIHYWNPDSTATEPGLIKTYPAESKQGYPLLQLKKIAEAEGLLSFALGMDQDPLGQVIAHVSEGRPVIAALELPKGRYFETNVPVIETTDRRTVTGLGDKTKAHYVVVMGTSRDRVLLMDPQYGYVDISQGDFVGFWKAMGYPALVCSEKPSGLRQQ
jgi:predicted double-glycine peptidase